MASYVEHFQYCVSDLEAAVRFYTTAFGWSIRGRGTEVTPARTYDWVHVGTDDSYLALRTPYSAGAMKEHPTEFLAYKNNCIGIVVDDLAEVLARLRSLGVDTPQVEAGKRTRVRIRDFDSNQIELIQY